MRIKWECLCEWKMKRKRGAKWKCTVRTIYVNKMWVVAYFEICRWMYFVDAGCGICMCVCVCANAQMMGIEIRVRKWFDCCKMKSTSLAFVASVVGIHMEIENVSKIKWRPRTRRFSSRCQCAEESKPNNTNMIRYALVNIFAGGWKRLHNDLIFQHIKTIKYFSLSLPLFRSSVRLLFEQKQNEMQ